MRTISDFSGPPLLVQIVLVVAALALPVVKEPTTKDDYKDDGGPGNYCTSLAFQARNCVSQLVRFEDRIPE
jgi:hypothetical protein